MSQPEIVIYTSPFCPYCHRAKALLRQKGATFNEIDVMLSPTRKREMVERAGGRTSVPQIFIGGHHVGGCDDLHALDAGGGLDPMLSGAKV